MRFFMQATLAALAVLLATPVAAQSTPSPFTRGMRYDAMHHLTGTISPDPDGSGSAKFAAVRNTYDANGRLVKVEKGEISSWQSESIRPASWTGFTVFQSLDISYDEFDHKTKELVRTGSSGTIYWVTQYSYDTMGRLQCTAVRMNSGVFNSLMPDNQACSLGTSGSNGPDRITKNVYDSEGQQLQVRKAVGTNLEQAYATYSYTPNGKQEYVVDANGNRAKLEYDNYDRLKKWTFPSTTKPTSFNPATPATALSTAGSLNTGDYEQYGYDANGNRTSLRKRDGSTVAYQYDALNRLTIKTDDAYNVRTDLASSYKRMVYNSYDLRGLQIAARFDSASGVGGTTSYNGFGEITSATDTLISGNPALAFQYDKEGDRTQFKFVADNQVFDMLYDGLDRLSQIKKSSTVLFAPTFNNKGQVTNVDRYGSALDQSASYDSVGRLSSLDFAAGSNSANVGWDFTRNAASQILTDHRDNDAYAWLSRQNANTSYTTNGLNQYSAVGNAAFCYDANANLTDDGVYVYHYDVENRLVEMRKRSVSGCPSYTTGYGGTLLASLHYDPAGRLYEALKYDFDTGLLTNTARFLYDGDAMVLEYNGENVIGNRYVHGSDQKADDPLLWYPGSSTEDTNVRNLYADPRGSIVLVMGSDGIADKINTYDEWGANDPTNLGRFQYTGQVWLDELGMYYYKARIYSPRLGRFMQTDPIGYKDQVNLYAYVANDPINMSDPTGSYLCNAYASKQCDALDGALGEARQALPHMSGQTASDLRVAINAFGTRGKDNGVTVRAGDTLIANTSTKDGRTTVTISSRIDSFDRLSQSRNDAPGAFLVAHEGQHIVDERAAGRDPKTPQERYDVERRGYALQGRVDRALGAADGGAMPVWKPGMSDAQMDRAARDNGWNSVCRAPTSCSSVDMYP